VSRPAATALLRAVLAAVPLALAAAAGILAGRVLLPDANGPLEYTARFMVGLGCSIVTLVLVSRVVRRFVPLVVLLRLSLVFPDHAPSRLALALRAGSVRRLRDWAEARGDEPDAQQQAEIVAGLVAALQAHDPRTRGHSERVRALTDLVVTEMRLPREEADLLRWGAVLHDIGKLEVPASLLNKRGRPDSRELQVIRRHPAAGARIAEPLASWLGEWRHAIDQHHEKFDGSGYPLSLRGDGIALSGRIVSITDAFETMTAVRAYKKAMKVADAREEVVRCAGSHFDPEIVRSFLGISVGRLRWVIGPVALLAQVPLLGALVQAGAGAGAALAGSIPSGLVGLAALVLSPGVGSPPPSSTNAANVPPPNAAAASGGASATSVASADAVPATAPSIGTDPVPGSGVATRPRPAVSVLGIAPQVVESVAAPVTVAKLPVRLPKLPELPELPGIAPLP
jgi:putative nucleotidyltransferase with HDIG domain